MFSTHNQTQEEKIECSLYLGAMTSEEQPSGVKKCKYTMGTLCVEFIVVDILINFSYVWFNQSGGIAQFLSL